MKSFLGKYLGHLAAYIGSSVGILAAINPALMPPVVKLVIAAASLVVAVAHHSYTAGNLAAAVKAAQASLIKAPVTLIASVIMLLVVCMPLTGCATVQSLFNSPAAPVVIVVGVDVAVAAAEQHGVSVQQINAVAKIALAADSSTSATLATVAAAANGEIAKLNLPPLDLAAANALEAVISAAVTQKLAGNADLVAAQADVAQVLQAVIVATGG